MTSRQISSPKSIQGPTARASFVFNRRGKWWLHHHDWCCSRSNEYKSKQEHATRDFPRRFKHNAPISTTEVFRQKHASQKHEVCVKETHHSNGINEITPELQYIQRVQSTIIHIRNSSYSCIYVDLHKRIESSWRCPPSLPLPPGLVK